LPTHMRPRLHVTQIRQFLARYDYPLEDDDLLARRSRVQKEKKMRLEDLCAVCDWKAPRAAGHARRNERREVEEITAAALRCGFWGGAATRDRFPACADGRGDRARADILKAES
jgi:hypothetical protein